MIDPATQRQMVTSLSQVRKDHLARYVFATNLLDDCIEDSDKELVVLDAACGVGYGSFILAEKGAKVFAVDNSSHALEWGEKYFNHPNITFLQLDLSADDWFKYLPSSTSIDAVVSFETLEHITFAERLVEDFSKLANILISSVPNEEAYPYLTCFQGKPHPHHVRHYTIDEYSALLLSWYSTTYFYYQMGKYSEVESGENKYARTLVSVSINHQEGENNETV